MNERVRRFILPLAFALLLGSVAVILNQRYLEGERQRIAQVLKQQLAEEGARSLIEVAVAARPIPEGTVIEQAAIKKGAVREEYAQPYVARHPREIVGKVALAPIAEGEQILTNKLRNPDEVPTGALLSARTPQGKRAVTIVVDAITGVGGFVRTGDIVDILWTLKEGGDKEAQVITLTLFQDVPVLSVGTEVAAKKGEDAKSQLPAGVSLVTLALAPQEVPFLLFAREQGKIQLSLRPRAESGSKVNVVPANLETMKALLNLRPVEPQVPTKTSREVEVYKGLERDVVAVPTEPEPQPPQ